MMYYKNTPLAFLFIAIVGVVCIIGVALFGERGLFILVVLALRPLFIERIKSKPDVNYWKLNLRIGTISLLLTAVTFIFIYFSSEWFLNSVPKPQNWQYVFFPYFVFITGIVGLFFSNKK
ncbi:MAG: hypothetical protein M1480_11155 [Bacteroidetes bacterium]|nr:hypothetical protein [Bacteroidota bacterium]